jgi:hypothetical protein
VAPAPGQTQPLGLTDFGRLARSGEGRDDHRAGFHPRPVTHAAGRHCWINYKISTAASELSVREHISRCRWIEGRDVVWTRLMPVSSRVRSMSTRARWSGHMNDFLVPWNSIASLVPEAEFEDAWQLVSALIGLEQFTQSFRAAVELFNFSAFQLQRPAMKETHRAYLLDLMTMRSGRGKANDFWDGSI